MTPLYELKMTNIVVFFVALYIARIVLRSARSRNSTRLKGPPRTSLVWGQNQYLRSASDVGEVYEEWAAKYGSVFRIPLALGKSRVVICDPLAISNFYSKETFVYVGTPLAKKFIARIFGKGLLWAEGENHRRQRKALAPAFTNAAVRRLTSVFFDSAYKLKTHWDTLIENHIEGSPVIDVQSWMNHIALDSIGIAGFSHDFGSLDGKPCTVADAFENLSTGKSSVLESIMFLLSVLIPILRNLPSKRQTKLLELSRSLQEIANILLERNKNANADINDEKSIIGLLIKAEVADGGLHLTEEEVLAQMNVLLLAGYETTSISLTWALIELSKQPALQGKLRKELQAFSMDPTWDQFMGPELPYLDAIVHETLRLHPPLTETTRVASADDILPLSAPLPTGATSVAISKGTAITAPAICINRAEAIWGPNAKEFYPDRWLVQEDGKEPTKVQWGKPALENTFREVQGHRHLLTFSDGPRTCLGKGFALTEFKVVLSVLIRNYTFEFPDGPETKIRLKRGVLPRPKVVGCEGTQVPMMVRKI
ncbi:cytochrome P450 [Gymnopus androsaceus JB14]|uniref:Cytochrome P450 n=1 Tax=Gymnopus androsaceus JB14 TaxID=1447944 RepID=A0A6A4HCM3_9AGAR|nr:cytochrome P450 [Gymnopus androsaceus JB14]